MQAWLAMYIVIIAFVWPKVRYLWMGDFSACSRCRELGAILNWADSIIPSNNCSRLADNFEAHGCVLYEKINVATPILIVRVPYVLPRPTVIIGYLIFSRPIWVKRIEIVLLLSLLHVCWVDEKNKPWLQRAGKLVGSRMSALSSTWTMEIPQRPSCQVKQISSVA